MFLASRPKFIGLAYSILRNKEDAEDAVQDAMRSAYRHLRSSESRSAFTTWFTRIVFNAALMIRCDESVHHYRSRERSVASQTEVATRDFRIGGSRHG
jgi:RNA polymerase sigma-70 factor (ECF subfamily)